MKPFVEGFRLYGPAGHCGLLLWPVRYSGTVLSGGHSIRSHQFGQQITTFILATIVMFVFIEPVAISGIRDGMLIVILGALGIGVLWPAISYRLADPSTISPFEYFGIPISCPRVAVLRRSLTICFPVFCLLSGLV